MRVLVCCLGIGFLLNAQEAARPPITGVAHIALYAKDVESSRQFYRDFLGYAEPFSLKNGDGSLALTFFKVNERQYIELFPEREAGSDRLHHISIETTDAEQMRRYLAARGVAVPEKVNRVRIGNLAFNVKDPDGHTVEIVEYAPDSWTLREKGRHLPASRISERLLHLGILVGATESALEFYRDILGFRETWRGSRNNEVLSWMNLAVPDGTDYIEFMLYDDLPPPDRRGVQHHICLEAPDMQAAVAQLEARRGSYDRPIEIRTGRNRRRQSNLYDPDGTRVELMESRTVDGKPAPWSDAKPPRER